MGKQQCPREQETDQGFVDCVQYRVGRHFSHRIRSRMRKGTKISRAIVARMPETVSLNAKFSTRVRLSEQIEL